MINPFDTADRPLVEPDNIVVGTFVAWNRQLDFDPTRYATKYLLRAGAVTRSIAGAHIGNGVWTYEIVAAISSAWTTGEYTWDLVLVRTADAAESIVQSGSISLFAASADRRDHARIMVDKITSILENRADSDVGSYTIKSRSITKMSVKELTEWREYYLAEIGRRPDAQGGKKNTVLVRFQ